jgi:hypothetical protein
MSLDIDVLLRAKARERESIDRIKNLLSQPLAFEPSKADAFRYEKSIEGNVVQLDLLADLPRRREDESVLKIEGATSSLEACLADGAENLGNHVETIQINCREGESLGTFEITVPDAVGFLILKTTVARFREKSKDPYDIYYYCRYSQDAATTRQMLASSTQEPAVARTVEALKKMFTHEDSKWVEMALDEMRLTGDARDREARFVVRAVGRAIEGLQPGKHTKRRKATHEDSSAIAVGPVPEACYTRFENDDTGQIHYETARQSRSALGIGLIIFGF